MLQEAKVKAALAAIAKGSQGELAAFRRMLADAPPGSTLAMNLQELVRMEEQEISLIGNIQRIALPSAKQLAKQAAVAGGKGAAHLLGRGITGLGKRLSALEEEPTPRRLPVVSYRYVVRGLSMPGQRYRPMTGGVGVDYFFDERLSELRPVNNPHGAIRLNEFEVEWFKQHAH